MKKLAGFILALAVSISAFPPMMSLAQLMPPGLILPAPQLINPNISGSGTATTQPLLDSSNKLATTAFVQNISQYNMATIPLNLGITGGGTYSFASIGGGGVIVIQQTSGVIINVLTIPVAGSNYAVGDILTPPTTAASAVQYVPAHLIVTSVNGSGGITGMSVLNGGTGYQTGGSGVLTAVSSGIYTYTLTGALSSPATVLFTPGSIITQSNQFNINNNTTGGQTVTMKISGQSGGVSTDTAIGVGTQIIAGSNNAAYISTDGVTDVWCVSGACNAGVVSATNVTASGVPVTSFSEMSPTLFGFKAGVDNTAAFAAYASYVANTPVASQSELVIPEGTYYADEIVWQGYNSGSTTGQGPQIRCLGHGCIFTPNPTNNLVFMTNTAGSITNIKFENIHIAGIGNTNPNQRGVVWFAEYNSANGTSNISQGYLDNYFQVDGFAKEQWITIGASSGTFAAQQFWNYGVAGFVRAAANMNPTMLMIGQHGQISGSNWRVGSGTTLNNVGPGLYIGRSINSNIGQPNGVTNGNLSFAANHTPYIYSGQAIELVPTTASPNWPTIAGASYVAGTTYYAAAIATTQSQTAQLGFATTASNLSGTGTLQTITAPVDYTSWQIVTMWPTSVDTVNNIIYLNDMLYAVTGDSIVPVGMNLPTTSPQIVSGTQYFIHRTDSALSQDLGLTLNSFYLYDTKAHAQAGGSTGLITISSAGTLTNYGFYLNGSSGSFTTMQSCNLGQLSIQGAEVGLMNFDGASVTLVPYFENQQRGIETRGFGTTFIPNGLMANNGNGTGGLSGSTGAAFKADMSGQIWVGNSVDITTSAKTFGTSGDQNQIFSAVDGGQVTFQPNIKLNIGSVGVIASSVTPDQLPLKTLGTLGSPGTVYTLGEYGSTLYVGGNKFVVANDYATPISSVSANMEPGDSLGILVGSGAAQGYIDFTTGGNLNIGGLSTIRARSGQTITFKLIGMKSAVTGLVFDSISSDWNLVTQSVTFGNASLSAINVSNGLDVTVGLLSGQLAVVAPMNMITGDVLTLRFTQNSTGNYVVALPSAFPVSSLGSGPANATLQAKFQYDGTYWQLISTSGWQGGVSTPFALSKAAVGVGIAPSGTTVGSTTGIITFGTSLPAPYSTGTGLYLYYPNTVTGTAGLYWTVCTTATACIVYNSTYTSGEPAVGTATPFTGLTGAAFTGVTGTGITLRSITLPGNTLSANGIIEPIASWALAPTANNKILNLDFNATPYASQTVASSYNTYQSGATIRNNGATNAQIGVNASINMFGGINAAPTTTTANTLNNTTLTTLCNMATATDYCILMGEQIMVTP